MVAASILTVKGARPAAHQGAAGLQWQRDCVRHRLEQIRSDPSAYRRPIVVFLD